VAESSPLYAMVVAAEALVRSSVPISCSLPLSVPGRCTVLTGARVATLAVGLVVSEAIDAAFSVVVAVGGGSFKLAREGSVCLEAVDVDDSDVRAVLAVVRAWFCHVVDRDGGRHCRPMVLL
jgi:hypothetical protein